MLNSAVIFGQIQLLNIEDSKTKACGCLKGDTLQIWFSYEDAFATIGIFEGIIDSKKKVQTVKNLLNAELYNIVISTKDTSAEGVFFRVFENNKTLDYYISGLVLADGKNLFLEAIGSNELKLDYKKLKFPLHGQLNLSSLGTSMSKDLIFDTNKIYIVNYNRLNSDYNIIISPNIKLCLAKQKIKIGKKEISINFSENGCFERLK